MSRHLSNLKPPHPAPHHTPNPIHLSRDMIPTYKSRREKQATFAKLEHADA